MCYMVNSLCAYMVPFGVLAFRLSLNVICTTLVLVYHWWKLLFRTIKIVECENKCLSIVAGGQLNCDKRTLN